MLSKKNNRPGKKDWIVSLSVIFLCLAGYSLAAQSNIQDENILDEFVKSKYSEPVIVFDSSNIKQYWIDNSVFSSDNSIQVQLNNYNSNSRKYESVPLKIQLANVNETQDCKVEIVTKEPNLSFNLRNSDTSILSASTANDDFIDYHIYSSLFHFENARDFSFRIVFSSDMRKTVSIKKIIMSFSHNKNSSFLGGAGKLKITKDNITTQGNVKIEALPDNAFSISGSDSSIRSKSKILCDNTSFSLSATIKNIGNVPTRVYLGYEAYERRGNYLYRRNYPYKLNNIVLKVISSNKDSASIVVDSYSDWEKNCTLAINAKEDLSDIPNMKFVDVKIMEFKKGENSSEILLDKPLKDALPEGTLLRVHGYVGGNVYPNIMILQPGEEKVFSSTIAKDETSFEFSNDCIPHGAYFVKPVLFSVSDKTQEENTVLISDFTVSFAP